MSKYYLENEESQSLRERQKNEDYDLIKNPEYYHEVNAALAKANEREDPNNVKIPRHESAALLMAADDYLDFDFICRAKMDKRYSGEPCQRDPAYIKAIAKATEELGKAKQAKIDENKLQASMAVGRQGLLGRQY